MNPGKAEGSLTAESHTDQAKEDAAYWKKRAFIYRMGKYSIVSRCMLSYLQLGPDEYFYKRRPQRLSASSSNSSINDDDKAMGDTN